MLTGLICLSSDLELPGWETLMPISGTCLVLTFADQHGAGRLLAARPMVGLGLISYSAYLYHAPVFAFVRIARLEPAPPALLASTIPLCLLLAWLSWRFVELPFRDAARTSNRQVLRLCAGLLALVVACGMLLHVTGGLRSWVGYMDGDKAITLRLTESYNKDPTRFAGRAFAAGERRRNLLVLGNSFARDFINMGQETGAFAGINLSYAPVQDCEPLPADVIARMREAGAVVIGSGVSAANAPCVLEQIAMLEALQVRHIVVLGSKQFGYNNNAVMLLPEPQRYGFRAKPLADATKANAAARAMIPARYYVDLFALLDNGTGTVPVFTPERKLISQDRKHLTRAGARYLGEKVFAQPQFSWLAKPGT